MHVAAPEKASMCRSKGAEKVYDYVVACNRLKGNLADGGGGRL